MATEHLLEAGPSRLESHEAPVFSTESSIVSAMVFWNDQPGLDFVLMEGIEGIYRVLGLIPFGRSGVRSISMECDYLVSLNHVHIAESADDVELERMWRIVPSEFSFKTIKISWSASNGIDFHECSLQPEQAEQRHFESEYLAAHVESNPPWGSFKWPFQNDSSRYGFISKDPNLRVHPRIVCNIHLKEIQSLLWISGGRDKDHTAQTITPETAKTALELWESKETFFKFEIESSQTELKDCEAHIFQWIIGFYAVTQVGWFALVLQPDSPLTCQQIHIAYILSIVISTFTIFKLKQKLTIMKDLRGMIYEYKPRLQALYRWQLELKRTGKMFDFGSATVTIRTRRASGSIIRYGFYVYGLVAFSAMLCYIMKILKCS